MILDDVAHEIDMFRFYVRIREMKRTNCPFGRLGYQRPDDPTAVWSKCRICAFLFPEVAAYNASSTFTCPCIELGMDKVAETMEEFFPRK